jgi:hypothetical protein
LEGNIPQNQGKEDYFNGEEEDGKELHKDGKNLMLFKKAWFKNVMAPEKSKEIFKNLQI